jgi:hypothetical protein
MLARLARWLGSKQRVASSVATSRSAPACVRAGRGAIRCARACYAGAGACTRIYTRAVRRRGAYICKSAYMRACARVGACTHPACVCARGCCDVVVAAEVVPTYTRWDSRGTARDRLGPVPSHPRISRMVWPCPEGSLGPATGGLACDGGSGASCAGGKPLLCPEYTVEPGYCIVRQADSVRVCGAVPGCEFISKCLPSNAACSGWNTAHPECVQLGAGFINTVNTDWVSCRKEPPGHAVTLVALALLLLCIYVAGGIVLASRGNSGRTSDGSLLKRHPHYLRWLALAGLVADGVAFSRAGGRRRGCSAAPLLRDSAASSRDSRKPNGKASSSNANNGGHPVKQKRSKAKFGSSSSPSREEKVQADLPTAPGTTVAEASVSTATHGSATPAGDGGRW